MTLSLWIATFVAAVLSGLGLGSAGIFVLYLTAAVGYGQVEAQSLNLLFFLFSAGCSLFLHAKKRRISWRAVLFLATCAIPGTLLGTWLTAVLDANILRRLFGGMLVVSGLPSLFSKKRSPSAVPR